MYKVIEDAPNYEVNEDGMVRRVDNQSPCLCQQGSYRLSNNGNYVFYSRVKLLRKFFTYEWIKDLRDGEEAKICHNHPDYYVTTHSRIFSLKRYEWLQPHSEDGIYVKIKLDKTKHAVHTLVGRTFLSDYVDGMCILHKDENLPSDIVNNLDNLRVGTHQDNTDDKIAKGRQAAMVPNDAKEYFQEFCEKYDKLVWFARSHPDCEVAKNPQSRVLEMFPDECDDLRSESGDWHHGFNSGCLATMRMVLDTLYPTVIPAEESDDGEEWIMGGLQNAKDQFPMLDT